MCAAADSAAGAPLDFKKLVVTVKDLPGTMIITSLSSHNRASYGQPVFVCSICESAAAPATPPGAAAAPVMSSVVLTVSSKKRGDPPGFWEDEVLPPALQLCWEWIDCMRSTARTAALVVVYDTDQSVASTVAVALIAALFDVRLRAHGWLVGAAGPHERVTKDTVKRAYACLQQRCPDLEQVPRRLMKVLNAYFTNPRSTWHAWLVSHLPS